MVVREERTRLLQLVDSYLAGEIRSNVFDERLFNSFGRDETVRFVAGQLWFFYDDFIDHSVNLNREQWDYIQRLRLLLASDAEIRRVRYFQWTSINSVAAASLAVFCIAMWMLGFGWHLLAVNLALAIPTLVLLTRANRALRRAGKSREPRRMPFESFRQLHATREQTQLFRKCCYPNGLQPRPKRSRVKSLVRFVPAWIASSVFLPFYFGMLMVQPFFNRREQLVMAAQSEA